MSRLIKTFQRIELPPLSNYPEIDTFLMESLAKPQWRKLKNETPHNLTPFIYFTKTKEEYQYWEELIKIQYHTSFFMKKFNILAYGHKFMDKDKDYLMVRGWLHESDKLNILIMMEKLEKEKAYENDYTFILNNPHWHPSLEFFKKRYNLNNDEITQEINQEKKTYQIY